MFYYICVKFLIRQVCSMYSKEFMKFLYEYQKDDFKPQEPSKYEIRFKNRGTGKPAEVFVVETNNR